MVKVKLSREEIIELIKKQFEVDEVLMDKFGNVSLELDLDKVVKEKKATYYTYPVYTSPQIIPPKEPIYYW